MHGCHEGAQAVIACSSIRDAFRSFVLSCTYAQPAARNTASGLAAVVAAAEGVAAAMDAGAVAAFLGVKPPAEETPGAAPAAWSTCQGRCAASEFA
jgi:hypothetical protein